MWTTIARGIDGRSQSSPGDTCAGTPDAAWAFADTADYDYEIPVTRLVLMEHGRIAA